MSYCDPCQRVFNDNRSLFQHWTNSSAHFFCGQCSSHLSEPLSEIHDCDNFERVTWSCEGCTLQFNNEGGFKAHFNGPMHNCTPCERHFIRPAGLQQHLINSDAHANGGRSGRQQLPPLFCEQCQRSFNNPHALEQHVTYSEAHADQRLVHDLFCHVCGEFHDGSDDDTHFFSTQPIEVEAAAAIFAHLHDLSATELRAATNALSSMTVTPPAIPVETTEEDIAGATVDMTCGVCFTKQRNRLFLPCAHMLCCGDCTRKLQADPELKCPLCRAVVTSVSKVLF